MKPRIVTFSGPVENRDTRDMLYNAHFDPVKLTSERWNAVQT
jgi:hypothetical protein